MYRENGYVGSDGALGAALGISQSAVWRLRRRLRQRGLDLSQLVLERGRPSDRSSESMTRGKTSITYRVSEPELYQFVGMPPLSQRTRRDLVEVTVALGLFKQGLVRELPSAERISIVIPLAMWHREAAFVIAMTTYRFSCIQRGDLLLFKPRMPSIQPPSGILLSQEGSSRLRPGEIGSVLISGGGASRNLSGRRREALIISSSELASLVAVVRPINADWLRQTIDDKRNKARYDWMRLKRGVRTIST